MRRIDPRDSEARVIDQGYTHCVDARLRILDLLRPIRFVVNGHSSIHYEGDHSINFCLVED